MNIHFQLSTANEKLGPMPVTTSSRDTCPRSCPFYNNGCYANAGRLRIHWKHVDEGKYTIAWRDFLAEIRKFPSNYLWRHNQAGDLAGNDSKINFRMLKELVGANKGRKGYTYTHKPLTADNKRAIKYANENGFTINLSGNNMKHADELKALNIGPVVAVMPRDFKGQCKTPAGNTVIQCMAMKDESMQCYRCGLCQRADRKAIIGFNAHGYAREKVNEMIQRI